MTLGLALPSCVYAAVVRDDALELLLTALPKAARLMEADSAKVAAAKLGENRYFRPALKAGLEAAAAERGLPVKLRLEHPFQCSGWRSRAGVDIGVRGLPRLAPVFCELKWGDGASVLGECSWDLAKMALAVAMRACAAAVLVAGAPRRRWTQDGLEGTELFASARHDLADVRGPLYLDKYWKSYAREGLPQPSKLPAAIETVHLATVPMDLDDGPWELRCVEVLPAGALVAVAPLPV
jgi:hypothetical protein